MDKEEQAAIDEVTEVADTETTEEQSDDTQTTSDTAKEPSDGDSSPDSASQTIPESVETETTPQNESDASHLNAPAVMDQRLSTLQEMFEKQIARNQNHKAMFDAVYKEMKEYKENTLLEAFHKPVIEELIRFYDHFVIVEKQLESISQVKDSVEFQSEDGNTLLKLLNKLEGSLHKKKERNRVSKAKETLEPILNSFQAESTDSQQSQPNTGSIDKLSKFKRNLEVVRGQLEEVLSRMDVIPYEEHHEEPLKKRNKKLHNIFDTIPTDDPDKHDEVKDVHKIGFYWREKVFRPEVVTIFKYEPSAETVDEETADEKPTAETKETVGEEPTSEKGVETDG